MVPVEVSSSRPYIDKNKHEMCFIEVEDCNGESASFPVFASYWSFCKDRFKGNGFYFMSVYDDETDKIMFGSRNRVEEERKKRMILPFKV